MTKVKGSFYSVSFKGRRKDAIGEMYTIYLDIESTADLTDDEVRLKVYENYDHVTQFEIIEKKFKMYEVNQG